ncbi:MAG: site-specific integrase [Acidobacteriia bacterium]|nr:site-specific integrase [Terriglobia bacterium]
MNNGRVRYQSGSLQLKGKKGKELWTLRFYESSLEGQRHYRRIVVGTKAEFPTRFEALRKAEAFRLSINTGTVQRAPVLFGEVSERYRQEELPERFSTRTSYITLLRKWIEPVWGSTRVDDIRALAVERWLNQLELAPKTKTNIRNMMHLLFENARRWEVVEKNPIELVRQSSRRRFTPRRLTAEELRSLLKNLTEPCRTMAILAACLGLRIGEIIGLQWGDIDLLRKTLSIRRTVWQYHVGPAKTEYSEAVLPLADELVSLLESWLSQAHYRTTTDWVFASDKGGLRDADKLRSKVLQPAAVKAKLGKIGWHTLRHSFATALDGAGARMKVAQELMRHANIATTMDVYTGVMERDKREAAGQVAKTFLGTVQ